MTLAVAGLKHSSHDISGGVPMGAGMSSLSSRLAQYVKHNDPSDLTSSSIIKVEVLRWAEACVSSLGLWPCKGDPK